MRLNPFVLIVFAVSRTVVKSGLKAGRQAARMPVFNSTLLVCQQSQLVTINLRDLTHSKPERSSCCRMLPSETLVPMLVLINVTYKNGSGLLKKLLKRISFTTDAAQALDSLIKIISTPIQKLNLQVTET